MHRLSKWLVRAGLVVWGVGAAAAVSGVWVTMPPIVVEWLVLSLAGTSGGLLVAAGVAVGRTTPITAAARAIRESGDAAVGTSDGAGGVALPLPTALHPTVAQRDPEREPAT